MKRILLLVLPVVFIIGFMGCKKKNSDNPPGPVCTILLVKDSFANNSVKTTREYEYNSDKRLVKVKYTYAGVAITTGYDTITYSTGTQIAMVQRYKQGTAVPYETNTYTYNSGLLSSVNETGANGNGPYNRTRTFTYVNGLINDMNLTYTSGTNDNEIIHIKNISVSNGNLVSAFLVDNGVDVTISTDLTAPNPYYGLNFESDNFLNLFCKNNVTTVYQTTMPANMFENISYTYSNGTVATITNNQGATSVTSYLRYDCVL